MGGVSYPLDPRVANGTTEVDDCPAGHVGRSGDYEDGLLTCAS